MKIKQLLDIAAAGYHQDVGLKDHYDDEGNFINDSSGDGFARFLVSELIDTFEEESEDQNQLNDAFNVIDRIVMEAESVREAIYKAQQVIWEKELLASVAKQSTTNGS